MSIDFHTEKNRYTYTAREVDDSWVTAISNIVSPVGKVVLDIGCGGGIYARAWAQMGSQQVTGIDFSEQMIAAAREHSAEIKNLSFQVGDALATGLEDQSADIIFARALTHHVPNLAACFNEAQRLLKPNGSYLIQNRTLKDVKYPASQTHLRGFLFERFPRLLAVEAARRGSVDTVNQALAQAGFEQITATSLWETRRRYVAFDQLAADLRQRTGRSILHELTDTEIASLIDYMAARLPQKGAIVEQDRWTIWFAQKLG